MWKSTDCGHFEDVIKAYNRLLDLKDKYIDIDVLKALKTSVEKNLTDTNGISILKHKQKILQLFGRITSLIFTNWKIYWYYGEICLHFSLIENDSILKPEEADKVFNLFLKGLKIITN